MEDSPKSDAQTLTFAIQLIDLTNKINGIERHLLKFDQDIGTFLTTARQEFSSFMSRLTSFETRIAELETLIEHRKKSEDFSESNKDNLN